MFVKNILNKFKILDKNVENIYNIWRIKIKKIIEENLKKLEQNWIKHFKSLEI